MNALRKQAEQETGISVPTYYNPLVVNPMMFAQQQAKRNLLWSKKDVSWEIFVLPNLKLSDIIVLHDEAIICA